MPKLEEQSKTPLYTQLADMLSEKITAGIWPAGSQMPTEQQLCDQYGVSRSTVRKAVATLVQKGLAAVVHGKGTFVAAPQNQQNASFSSTSQYSMQVYGKPLRSKVLFAGLLPADAQQREFFDISQQPAQLVVVKRLRYLDQRPFCLETISFPMEYLQILGQDFTGSLYEILKNEYDVYPAGGYRTYTIVSAAGEEAELCGVKPDTPQLLISDFVRDQDAKPLHVTRRIHFDETVRFGIPSQELFG